MGLHRAGFHVVGIDNRPQKRYPFRFIQADALRPPVRLSDFDLIWASPPCQAHSAMRTMWNARKDHDDLIPATRQLLRLSGRPHVIENVPGASTLRSNLTLCGSQFGLGCEDADLRRHRCFETTFMVFASPCQHGREIVGVYGGHGRNRKRPTIGVYGGGHSTSLHRREKGEKSYTAEQQREAMGMPWATVNELSQAIPPAYAEHIGRYAMMALNGTHA